MAPSPFVCATALTWSLAILSSPRVWGFKVIGAGLPKTGTSALAIALDELGFHTYHAGMWHRYHAANWTVVLQSDARRPLFTVADELVARGYTAALDTPIPSLTPALLEHFPRAKVILTHRDMDSWFASFMEQARSNIGMYRVGLVPQENVDFMEATNRELYNCTSHPPSWTDKAGAVKAHQEHIARIRRYVPAGQLLEFNLTEGWGPLCHFLDVPVPSSEFPSPWLAKSASKRMIERVMVMMVSMVSILCVSMCCRCRRFLRVALCSHKSRE